MAYGEGPHTEMDERHTNQVNMADKTTGTGWLYGGGSPEPVRVKATPRLVQHCMWYFWWWWVVVVVVGGSDLERPCGLPLICC